MAQRTAVQRQMGHVAKLAAICRPQCLQFDYHAALLGLPLAFKIGLDTIPAAMPYLCADAKRVLNWKMRIGDAGYKTGISCQENAQSDTDAGRSFPLDHFAAFCDVPGVRLISLQKNEGTEQLQGLPANMKVETLGAEFDAGPDAFLDAAAVMENLDRAATSDMALAHLAGALARPVWVAMRHMPDWRWLLDRTDSPWYPTMRFFRQPTRGGWQSVFDEMKTALTERLS